MRHETKRHVGSGNQIAKFPAEIGGKNGGGAPNSNSRSLTTNSDAELFLHLI